MRDCGKEAHLQIQTAKRTHNISVRLLFAREGAYDFTHDGDGQGKVFDLQQKVGKHDIQRHFTLFPNGHVLFGVPLLYLKRKVSSSSTWWLVYNVGLTFWHSKASSVILSMLVFWCFIQPGKLAHSTRSSNGIIIPDMPGNRPWWYSYVYSCRFKSPNLSSSANAS